MVDKPPIFCAFILLLILYSTMEAVADNDVLIDFIIPPEQRIPSQKKISAYGLSSALIQISNSLSSYYFWTTLNTKQYLINYGEITYPSYHHAGHSIIPLLPASRSIIDHKLSNSLIDMAMHHQYAPSFRQNMGLVFSQALPGTQVITYINSKAFNIKSPTIVSRADLLMAYAYLLFHEGCPLIDASDCFHKACSVEDTLTLSEAGKEIVQLIKYRRKYIQGDTDILTTYGCPDPSNNTEYLYIARRGGHYYDDRKTQLSGAIFVLNTHSSEPLSVWVTTGGNIYEPWRNTYLTDLCHPEKKAAFVWHDGRVQLQAPPRGYAIYTLQTAARSIDNPSPSEPRKPRKKTSLSNYPLPSTDDHSVGNPSPSGYLTHKRKSSLKGSSTLRNNSRRVSWQDDRQGASLITVKQF